MNSGLNIPKAKSYAEKNTIKCGTMLYPLTLNAGNLEKSSAYLNGHICISTS